MRRAAGRAISMSAAWPDVDSNRPKDEAGFDPEPEGSGGWAPPDQRQAAGVFGFCSAM